MIETLSIEQDNYVNKKNLYVIISIGLSFLLILPQDIMWAQDRFFYLSYAEFSWTLLLNNFSQGILVFSSNEPFFLVINSVLDIVLSPENVVKVIIFTSAFLTLYSLGRLSNYNLLVFFLFICSPTVLLKYTTHLRQGLAMSLYFLGLHGYLRNKKWGNIRFLTPFIHSSMAFVLFYEMLEYLYKKKKFNSNLKLFVSAITLMGLLIFISDITTLLGDRRTELYVYEFGLSGSGLGFLFWLLVGTYFIIFKKKGYINMICNYGIVFYLLSYFYLDYGARVFESIFPLIILSTITDKRKWFKISYGSFLILYAILTWYQGVEF